MKLDLTITLGTIVQTAIFLVTFVWAGARIYGEFREMRVKLNTLWKMIVGDPSLGVDGRGLEAKIDHAVRTAISDKVAQALLGRH